MNEGLGATLVEWGPRLTPTASGKLHHGLRVLSQRILGILHLVPNLRCVHCPTVITGHDVVKKLESTRFIEPDRGQGGTPCFARVQSHLRSVCFAPHNRGMCKSI